MAKKDGGPAFPVIGAQSAPEDYPGMSLRDWFAGQAMSGMLAHPEVFDDEGVAEDAYRMADAMLAARED